MSINVLSRKLVPTSEAASHSSEHEFTVLQWNVLADWLCDAKAFPHAHNEDCLKWDNRATAFKQILAAGPLPDLVSMQEVDHWDDFFKVEMEKLGLKGHFYKKEAADAADGSVLCWRPEMFELIELERLRLEEQQSQVAIFALLLHKPSQRQVLMVTTHLKAKPGFEERRALQGARILNKAKEIAAAKCKTSPLVIIAGDFNDTPESLVAKLFRGNTVITEKAGSLNNTMGALHSAYASSSTAISYEDCKDALYTTYKKRETEVCRTIDYIWYTPLGVEISALMDIPPVDQLEHRLPAEYYPSDHFAVAASLRLK